MKIPLHKVGDRIKFRRIKMPLKVMARGNGFTICARRMSGCCAKLEQYYTIVDWREEIRGGDNYYNKFLYTNPNEAQKAIKLLGRGLKRVRFNGRMVWSEPQLEISHRNQVPLDFECVIKA